MNREKLIHISILLLRLVAALVMIQAGGLKLLGWFGGMPEGTEMTTLILIASLLELIGGTLIALGLFMRPAAFILSGEMAVAYFIGHASQGFFFAPLMNGGIPPVLLSFIFLFLAVYGAGAWSIDAFIQKRKMAVQSQHA